MRSKAPDRVLLFTGLLRHPDMFERQLELAHGLEAVDRRIFATWTDDFTKNETRLRILQARFGLEIVHSPQPAFVVGHFLHQMLSLDTGLLQVNDRDVVLKSRTDIVIAPEALTHVLCKERRLTGDGLHRDLYIDSAIDVVEAQISTPFMYDDIAFCGVAADLRRLVNMEMMFQVVYRCNTFVHERFFGALFASRVAFLKDWYRNSWVLGGDDRVTWARLIGNDYRRAMTAFAMRDRDYGVMMALSYLVTAQMISFDWGPRRPFLSFRGAAQAQPVSAPRWGGQGFATAPTLDAVFASPGHYTEPDAIIAADTDAFFARVVSGGFADGAIDRNIRDGLAAVQAASGRDLQTLADMRGFVARAEAHSKEVLHGLLPRFQQKAHELAGLDRAEEAQWLIKGLISHMAA